MDVNRDKIIDRVKKLLNLASSNFKAEAEAAMLKAQELLLSAGLSMSDVDTDTFNQKKEVADDEITLKRNTLHWYEKQMLSIISDNFRC